MDSKDTKELKEMLFGIAVIQMIAFLHLVFTTGIAAFDVIALFFFVKIAILYYRKERKE